MSKYVHPNKELLYALEGRHYTLRVLCRSTASSLVYGIQTVYNLDTGILCFWTMSCYANDSAHVRAAIQKWPQRARIRHGSCLLAIKQPSEHEHTPRKLTLQTTQDITQHPPHLCLAANVNREEIMYINHITSESTEH